MRTFTAFFAFLLFAGSLFIAGCFPKETQEQTAIPLDYLIQKEMGKQLQLMLADTSLNANPPVIRKFTERYLTAVSQFEESFDVMGTMSIKLPPPPPPPCLGCIDLRRLLVRDNFSWDALQVLDSQKAVVAGFRKTEAPGLIEPDLKEGMALPESGFLRVPAGDGFMDIPMNFAR